MKRAGTVVMRALVPGEGSDAANRRVQRMLPGGSSLTRIEFHRQKKVGMHGDSVQGTERR